MTAIKTDKLTKRYGTKTAVDSLTLEIGKGELFGLLGVNGAGKTTTIKMLSCLIAPTSGDADICGHSIVHEPSAVKRLNGVSPQETAVAPNLTVRENLELMCGINGMPVKEQHERAAKVINDFSLEEIADSRAKILSGGWCRRLSIAMALVTDPEIIFLDEPTLGLDAIARRELWKHIESIKGKKTVILTTHYLEEAEALCDRIAIMVDGNIAALGSVEEIKTLAGEENFEEEIIKRTGQGRTVR